jgi:hypothetical protein
MESNAYKINSDLGKLEVEVTKYDHGKVTFTFYSPEGLDSPIPDMKDRSAIYQGVCENLGIDDRTVQFFEVNVSESGAKQYQQFSLKEDATVLMVVNHSEDQMRSLNQNLAGQEREYHLDLSQHSFPDRDDLKNKHGIDL